MKVAIIGTGMLGAAVGMRLVAEGAEVSAYNRTASKTRGLEEAGAAVAKTPADAARGCDAVITCVTNAAALEEVCLGSGGLAELGADCPTVCDMSTIGPDESRRITERLAAYSVVMLGTPVMGGPDAAATGGLVMMVSGSEDALAGCRDILSITSGKIFYLGDAGNAHAVKLAMNLQIAMLALSISEGILFSESSGVGSEKFLDVLNATYFGTGMSRKKAHGMAEGKVSPTFLLRNLKKDLDALGDAASKIGLDLLMGKKAGAAYGDAVDCGYGELDYTGIIEYLRKR